MSRKTTFRTTIERDIDVSYEWIPGRKGGTDGFRGLPLEPDEPAHAEIDTVQFHGTHQDVELTPKEQERLLEELAEDHYERSAGLEYE